METTVRKPAKNRAREAVRNHSLAAKTPEQVGDEVDAMELAQLKELVKFLWLREMARG